MLGEWQSDESGEVGGTCATPPRWRSCRLWPGPVQWSAGRTPGSPAGVGRAPRRDGPVRPGHGRRGAPTRRGGGRRPIRRLLELRGLPVRANLARTKDDRPTASPNSPVALSTHASLLPESSRPGQQTGTRARDSDPACSATGGARVASWGSRSDHRRRVRKPPAPKCSY
ncbi:hypothetical protein DMH26_26800 [Streptomyces sp. WAC 05379]|nr:hypothetical protein DMH26_26800 [Streptomyces sp. WAC 05379]